MALGFNAREIFDMGVRIEENGKAFYAAAARKIAETSMREFFKELSAWEAQHIVLFQKLRGELPESAGTADIFDPNGEAEMYIDAMADGAVFQKNANADAQVATCKGPEEIIRMAIGFEKDSVVFYTVMRRAVGPNLGQDQIDTLIGEEVKHISMLSEKVRKLPRA